MNIEHVVATQCLHAQRKQAFGFLTSFHYNYGSENSFPKLHWQASLMRWRDEWKWLGYFMYISRQTCVGTGSISTVYAKDIKYKAQTPLPDHLQWTLKREHENLAAVVKHCRIWCSHWQILLAFRAVLVLVASRGCESQSASASYNFCKKIQMHKCVGQFSDQFSDPKSQLCHKCWGWSQPDQLPRLTKVFSFRDLHRLGSDRGAITTCTAEQTSTLIARASIFCTPVCAFRRKCFESQLGWTGLLQRFSRQTARTGTMQMLLECFAWVQNVVRYVQALQTYIERRAQTPSGIPFTSHRTHFFAANYVWAILCFRTPHRGCYCCCKC